MTTNQQCNVSNGSYTCRQEHGHDGSHVARFRSASEWRLAIFKDAHSTIEFVRSSVQENVR